MLLLSIQAYNMVNHDVFFILLLFRIVSSLKHIHLPLFMIDKVNVTLLRQWICVYCLFKRIIRLNHDVFLILLLFRIVSSLKHIHLPLFMNDKVNVTLLRQFICFYCLFKGIIGLNLNIIDI